MTETWTAPGYELVPDKLEAWALAHGWSRDNARHLARYAREIAGGKRPRFRSVLKPDAVMRIEADVRGA